MVGNVVRKFVKVKFKNLKKMDRNSSNGDGPKSKFHQTSSDWNRKVVENSSDMYRNWKSEIAETPKGNSLSKVQFGRYVQVISLDISTLSEPLRWAFPLIGGMPPSWTSKRKWKSGSCNRHLVFVKAKSEAPAELRNEHENRKAAIDILFLSKRNRKM